MFHVKRAFLQHFLLFGVVGMLVIGPCTTHSGEALPDISLSGLAQPYRAQNLSWRDVRLFVAARSCFCGRLASVGKPVFCYTATILHDLGFVLRFMALSSRATKKDAGIKGKRVHNVTDNALVLPRCSLLLFLVAHLSFFSLR